MSTKRSRRTYASLRSPAARTSSAPLPTPTRSCPCTAASCSAAPWAWRSKMWWPLNWPSNGRWLRAWLERCGDEVLVLRRDEIVLVLQVGHQAVDHVCFARRIQDHLVARISAKPQLRAIQHPEAALYARVQAVGGEPPCAGVAVGHAHHPGILGGALGAVLPGAAGPSLPPRRRSAGSRARSPGRAAARAPLRRSTP